MKIFNIICLLLTLVSLSTSSQEIKITHQVVVNLEGPWKFMIGDESRRAEPDFNDSGWESITVPSSWENQQFYGYDGYGWYRKSFRIPERFQGEPLMLFLGYIDDVDATYLNGQKIGHQGSFPPQFWTAYNAQRQYVMPAGLLNFNGENTLAVRVYDARLEGGIIRGPVGIFHRQSELESDMNLEGYWKFRRGDNMSWKAPDYDDNGWKQIHVPGIWEDQVSRDYNGFGWYRKKFRVPEAWEGERYVLMLGKIDDADEVYINGEMVGHTGELHKDPSRIQLYDEHNQPRYYYLEREDLNPGTINTIAIRVFDRGGEGGIYKGPVGLVELRKFVRFWRNR